MTTDGCLGMTRHRFQASFRWAPIFANWRLGSRQCSFDHIARVLQCGTYGRLRWPLL